jgi:hypothetical protein
MNEAAYRRIIFRVTGKEPATYKQTVQSMGNIDENVSVGCGSQATPFELDPTRREIPAPYFLGEILGLHRLSLDARREIHKAKLAYGEVRLWEDG